ncbi:MAG: hypothetical protein AAF617_18470 [Bacteroidota bacterium]
MKKKNFKHKGLNLRKNVVSNLASENVKGGFTASCLADADTNCASVNCVSNGCPPPTGTCPPTQTLGFPCGVRTISCPNAGIC